MSNTPSSSFPASQKDVSQLKQTATDAASDLGSAAAPHLDKAKEQVKRLAGDLQEEGSAQLDQVKGQFCTVLNSAKEYASAQPLVCIGVALAIGLLIGLTRSSSRE
jgi:ElaB/YqjD/DUF883 family membrane-anchored ribosome-binding protein